MNAAMILMGVIKIPSITAQSSRAIDYLSRDVGLVVVPCVRPGVAAGHMLLHAGCGCAESLGDVLPRPTKTEQPQDLGVQHFRLGGMDKMGSH